MKSRIISHFFAWLLPFAAIAQGYQVGTGILVNDQNAMKVTGSLEFISPFPGDPSFSLVDMPAIRLADLFTLQKGVLESIPGSEGILGTIDKPGGYIKVKVFAAYTIPAFDYEDKGAVLLYSASITHSSTDFTSETDPLERNIKYNLTKLSRYGPNACTAGVSAFKVTLLSISKSQAFTWPNQPANTCNSETSYSPDQPVVLSIEVKDATLYDIRIPGLLPNLWDYNSFAESSITASEKGHTIKKRETWPVPPTDVDVLKRKVQIAQFVCKSFSDYVSSYFSASTNTQTAQKYLKWLWEATPTQDQCPKVSSFGLANNNADVLQRFNPDEEEQNQAAKTKICGTDEVFAKEVNGSPQILIDKAAVEKEIQNFLDKPRQRDNHYPVIPVVFHVLYSSDQQRAYLSETSLQQVITDLNNNFSMANLAGEKKSPGAWAAWGNRASGIGFRFALANRRPDGTTTTGIEYKFVSRTTYGTQQPDFFLVYTALNNFPDAGLNPYPKESYLNIWIVPELQVEGVPSYGFCPDFVAAKPAQGIYLSAYIFNPAYRLQFPSSKEIPTHELLHFMGLRHLWDTYNPNLVTTNPCLGDDGAPDTHQQMGPNMGSPNFPVYSCNIAFANTPGGELKSDMINNFMDYTALKEMQTQGQAARAEAVIEVLRPGLLTSQGYVPPTANRSFQNMASAIVEEKAALSNTTVTSRLYPTMTTGKITIEFNKTLNSEALIRVFDIRNARQILLLKSFISGNLLSFTISNYGLIPENYYRIVVETGGRQYQHTVILTRNSF